MAQKVPETVFLDGDFEDPLERAARLSALGKAAAIRAAKAPRVTLTKLRLRIVLETANAHGLPEIYYQGTNIQHGSKIATLKKIHHALKTDSVNFPTVPQDDTLCKWIDQAVKERQGQGPDEDQTGDGDDPVLGKLGVCTETPLRDAVDEYIRRGKAAARRKKLGADKKDAEEAEAEELLSEAMSGRKNTKRERAFSDSEDAWSPEDDGSDSNSNSEVAPALEPSP